MNPQEVKQRADAILHNPMLPKDDFIEYAGSIAQAYIQALEIMERTINMLCEDDADTYHSKTADEVVEMMSDFLTGKVEE